ncbi:hypothetical protein R3P38DRAFT_3236830 [Favolaschia claudopus]|uniref:Uncharacterized protein n=1 Tax=Favolaschia claudopus TaxID=2862362 RepID=A0AAV9ZBZ2_9AGAR
MPGALFAKHGTERARATPGQHNLSLLCSRALGTSFGVAISTIVFNAVAGSDNAGEDAPLKAYKAAQWACAGMAFFCSLLAILFMRGVGPVGVDERKVALSEVDAESRVSTFQKDEKNVNGGGGLS